MIVLRSLCFLISTAGVMAVVAGRVGAAEHEPFEPRVPAPELEKRAESDWINSKPLRLTDLRGKVVVVHFWAFGCINCIRNQPHYRDWHERFAKQDVTMIGIHTPETEHERDGKALRQEIRKKKLAYPIVIDGDAKDWKRWGNRWWPCTYLIDKQGIVRYRWDGELNWKGIEGEASMRKKIEELLAEPAPEKTARP